MPVHNFAPLRGELRRMRLDAPSLRDNRLGDPSTREVLVYLPPEFEREAHLPLFIGLAAFTGSGFKLNNWQSFGETLPQRHERLVAEGKMGPVVLAMPDAFTSLGGNQYLDTPWLGNWSTFLRCDLLDALELELGREFPPKLRALLGHSSGGYGALMQGLRHSENWAAIACHSGDMGFDWLYRADLPKAARALAAHGGSIPDFLEALAQAPSMRGESFYALMTIAMAASYDPQTSLHLPIDLETSELDDQAWARWLAHDPVHIAESRGPGSLAGLGKLRGLFIDCGLQDEYNLHFGARRFCRALDKAKVAHTHEEFRGGHSKVAFRYDRSLPFLYDALRD